MPKKIYLYIKGSFYYFYLVAYLLCHLSLQLIGIFQLPSTALGCYFLEAVATVITLASVYIEQLLTLILQRCSH